LFRQQCDADTAYRSLKSHAKITRYKPRLQRDGLCPTIKICQVPSRSTVEYDTVGSGDAFTAGLVHEYLEGASLGLMNEVANLVGAWVASEVGAMPAPKRGALAPALAEIR
jgi:sugar/nucleoside kinase (ribokinase family)